MKHSTVTYKQLTLEDEVGKMVNGVFFSLPVLQASLDTGGSWAETEGLGALVWLIAFGLQ